VDAGFDQIASRLFDLSSRERRFGEAAEKNGAPLPPLSTPQFGMPAPFRRRPL